MFKKMEATMSGVTWHCDEPTFSYFRIPENQSFDSWIKRMIAQPSEGNKSGQGNATVL